MTCEHGPEFGSRAMLPSVTASVMDGHLSGLMCCVCAVLLWPSPVTTAVTDAVTTAAVTDAVTGTVTDAPPTVAAVTNDAVTAAPTAAVTTAAVTNTAVTSTADTTGVTTRSTSAGEAAAERSGVSAETPPDEINANWDQVLDVLLGLVGESVNATISHQWTALAERLDGLDSEVQSGSRQVSDTSDGVRRLLAGQTRLDTVLHELQQLLTGQSRTQTEHGALQQTLTQLQESQIRLQESQTQLQESLTQLLDSQTRLQESQTQLQESQTQLQSSVTQLQASVTQIQTEQTQTLALTDPDNQHRPLTSCPDGWARSGASCFTIPPGVASWYHAERTCELVHRQAKLASVHPENQQFVRRLFTEDDGTNFWIGLVRQGDSPGWSWADGTALDYTGWMDGEPNNSGGMENCVHEIIASSVQGWNDRDCSHQLKMLCQIALK